MIPYLDAEDPFPPVDEAMREPNGLLAAGGDLSSSRLLDAYRRGIFPWFSDEDPLLWWSPDPRMVLYVDELVVSRSLRKTIRTGRFRVTADRAFSAVMSGCAEPREDQDGTWITTEMRAAYARLAAMGYAHSVEAWRGDQLAGGLYGVAIGRVFFGESMFARVSDASKVAFVTLVRQLQQWGFRLIDCQMPTAHLASLGAREVPRREFLAEVDRAVLEPPIPSPWTLEPVGTIESA
jgi:leucyl/phenylalanyl-tRNA---protein transferase